MSQQATQSVFVMRADALEEVMRHAHEEAPVEACGIVTETGRVIRMRNISGSETFFQFDSDEYVRVWTEIHDAGDHIGAYYHSHTKGPARPSQVDEQFARPGAFYLIISTETETATAWKLVLTRLVEHPVILAP